MAEEKTTPEESSTSEVSNIPAGPSTSEVFTSPDTSTLPLEKEISEEPAAPKITTSLAEPPTSQPEPQPAPPVPAVPAVPAVPKTPTSKKRSRFGLIVLSLLFLLIGIIVGAGVVLLFFLGISGTNHPITSPTAQPGNITVEADATLLGPIAEQSLQEAGIPGTISNIQIVFADGDAMTITGQYQYTVLGISAQQNFSIQLQPYVNACNLQIHVIQANFGKFPITGFVSIFENTINQKLQENIPSTIENGKFALCISGVHTQPGSITLNFSVTPQPA